jgi:DNA invertase Pin-like site-specific DNA recombinase
MIYGYARVSTDREIVGVRIEVLTAARSDRQGERTSLGRVDAKANGVKFGRRPILVPHRHKDAYKRVEAGEPRRGVVRSYNVRHATISLLTR